MTDTPALDLSVGDSYTCRHSDRHVFIQLNDLAKVSTAKKIGAGMLDLPFKEVRAKQVTGYLINPEGTTFAMGSHLDEHLSEGGQTYGAVHGFQVFPKDLEPIT